MYKLSKYNVAVYNKDKVIYCNCLKGSTIQFLPEEHINLNHKWQDPIEFELAYPTVFEKFKDWGFFVEDDLDEFLFLKSMYNKRVNSKEELHLFINLSFEDDVQGLSVIKFKELLKVHISKYLLEQNLKQVVLEWRICKVSQIEKILHPINNFVCNECKNKGINFFSQVELVSVKLLSYTYLLTAAHVNALYIKILVGNEQKVDNMITMSFGNFVKYFTKLSLSNVKLPLYLSLLLDNNISLKQVERVKGVCSGLIDKSSVYISVNYKDKNLFVENKATKEYREMYEFTKCSYTILQDGSIYFGRYIYHCRGRMIGKVMSNGDIEYNMMRAENFYSIEWFNNSKCSQCKYLPLMLNICCHSTFFRGTSLSLTCPADNGTIDLEKIVIQLHEKNSTTCLTDL